MITRFADAIGAKPHSECGLTREQAIAHEGRFFDLGYANCKATISATHRGAATRLRSHPSNLIRVMPAKGGS